MSGPIAYLLLLIPTLLALGLHMTYIPRLQLALSQIFEGAAFPNLTQMALGMGPGLVTISVVLLILSIASFRCPPLRHQCVLAAIGAALATLLLIYGLSLTLPFVTFDILGDARGHARPNKFQVHRATTVRVVLLHPGAKVGKLPPLTQIPFQS